MIKQINYWVDKIIPFSCYIAALYIITRAVFTDFNVFLDFNSFGEGWVELCGLWLGFPFVFLSWLKKE